jgi:hypothetical protein
MEISKEEYNNMLNDENLFLIQRKYGYDDKMTVSILRSISEPTKIYSICGYVDINEEKYSIKYLDYDKIQKLQNRIKDVYKLYNSDEYKTAIRKHKIQDILSN